MFFKKKFDIICISETYLHSGNNSNDNSSDTSGYILVRSDQPSSNKRGSVCIYYKSFLPPRILNVQLKTLTSKFGLYQVMKELTYILDTSSSCINLIFTSHPHLITEFRVHLSLHSNCDHFW